MVSDLIALETCRSGREQCVARLDAAADDAGTMQDRLETTPAPDCLSAAGQRLQDALTFQQRGLRTASTGVETENRVRLVQGLLLTGAGLWRAGQAIVAGRQSSC